MKLIVIVVSLLATVNAHGGGHSNGGSNGGGTGSSHDKCFDETCPSKCINKGKDCKVYLFAFTQIAPGSFFDGLVLTGSHVRLMEEICCRAKKRCAAAMFDFGRCWKGDGTSDVLNDRWADGCIEVSTIPRREATYLFSRVPLFSLGDATVIVNINSGITVSDLQMPMNVLDIAYMANPNLATAGALQKFKDAGYQVNGTEIPFVSANTNQEAQDVIDAVIASNTTIGIVAPHLIPSGIENVDIIRLFDLDCPLGDSALMIRKDDPDMLCWFDDAYLDLLCDHDGDDYAAFCQDMEAQFGPSVVNCLPEDQREAICDAQK